MLDFTKPPGMEAVTLFGRAKIFLRYLGCTTKKKKRVQHSTYKPVLVGENTLTGDIASLPPALTYFRID
jgi:hypothetical protein